MVKQLARRLDVSEESIRSELGRRPGFSGRQDRSLGTTPSDSYIQPNKASGTPTELGHKEGRRELLEEKFLILCAMVPEAVRECELKEHHIIFRSAEKQNIFALVASSSGAAVAPSPSAIQDLEMFKFKSEVIGRDIHNVEQEFLVCKRELEKECIREKMQEHQEEMERQEKEGNHHAVNNLLQDAASLHKILKQLSAS